ncbi:MAG: threonine synthase [Saprospiraceae bacterium]
MYLYSTKNRDIQVDLQEAVFKGLPDDNGLYMPNEVPQLPADFFEALPNMTLQEIGVAVCKHLFNGAIPDEDIEQIVNTAIDFPAPVVQLDKEKYVLELFHGPSLAFKDFGARFMAQLMSYFNRDQEKDLTILVATSGDTGGAVAAGFYQTPGIRVVILYPKGKVSALQEKQLTTLGHNITAIEVDGTFDDCQALVKQAFLDQSLRSQFRISSANSINISRLIPQSFYYFEAWKQVVNMTGDSNAKVVFCVPSGNFGNLTAGLLAHQMGLPVHHFIAATNVNDVVPVYLEGGVYEPRPSVRTISNAMDVGNPSNFARMIDVFAAAKGKGLAEDIAIWNRMKSIIIGYGIDDLATEDAVREVYGKYDYILDPHGAVGYLALEAWQKEHPNTCGVVLETAHPSKFKEDMDRILGMDTPVPDRLAALANKQKEAYALGTEYAEFKAWMINTLP